jgi:hypothetical protein
VNIKKNIGGKIKKNGVKRFYANVVAVLVERILQDINNLKNTWI